MNHRSKSNGEVVIADLAAKAGVSLNEVGAETLGSLLNSAGRFETGKPVITIGEDGKEIGAADWFASKIKEFPAFLVPKPADKPLVQLTGNRTERAIATLVASKRDRTGEAEALVSRLGNPWKTGNRTHAGFVQNVAPELAAKLKLEAGA